MNGGLVIDRKVGESVLIKHAGEDLVMTIVERRGNFIKFSFVGSKDFRVERTNSYFGERGIDRKFKNE